MLITVRCHTCGQCFLAREGEDVPNHCLECSRGSLSGYKDDHGKLRMDLIPPEAVQSLARVLTYGCTGKAYRPDCSGKKDPYPERNWESGMDWGRVFAALQRHIWAWWARDPHDLESGLSHLEHVLCCAAFLVTFEKRRIGDDSRVGAISDGQFMRMLRDTLVDSGLIAPETAAEIARTEGALEEIGEREATEGMRDVDKAVVRIAQG